MILCRFRIIGVVSSIPTQVKYVSNLSAYLNDQIDKDLLNEVYKPKHHPGRTTLKSIELPQHIQYAIKTAVKDNQVAQLMEDGSKIDRYLFARHVPLEQKEKYLIKKQIENELMLAKGIPTSFCHDENSCRVKEMIKQEVMNVYHQRNYNWQPILYDSYKAWAYLFGRAAKEYAVIKQVFNEIVKRDPEFSPRSFFDFGAGIGTGTWAASEFWRKSLYEYFLVDESRDMNELSELILRDGNEDKQMSLRNVFYRQFLPASDEFKSHLILSAFTLNELPDLKTRLDTLLTLWKKCDGYMVLIENGTNAGFKLIEESRDFLLQQATKENTAFIFAPCAHQLACPRMLKNDGTPCNFCVSYRSLGIGQNARDQKVLFSYIIFKKGSRKDDKTIDWPRLVRPTQVRTRHTRCKMCTNHGKLEELVITKAKHSKYTYRCARKSCWGDRLPIEFEDIESNQTSNKN